MVYRIESSLIHIFQGLICSFIVTDRLLDYDFETLAAFVPLDISNGDFYFSTFFNSYGLRTATLSRCCQPPVWTVSRNIMHLCLFDLHKYSLQHPFRVNLGVKSQACTVLPSPVTCLDEALHCAY